MTQEELVLITGRKNRDAQLRALRALGIDYKERFDGKIVISTAHAKKLLGVKMQK